MEVWNGRPKLHKLGLALTVVGTIAVYVLQSIVPRIQPGPTEILISNIADYLHLVVYFGALLMLLSWWRNRPANGASSSPDMRP